MTTYNWFQLIAMIASIFIIPLAGMVWRMRRNDIRHITERLDKIEELLQIHIQWHLDHKPE